MSLLLLYFASRAVVPVRFDVNAIHLASGENDGPVLSVVPLVICFFAFAARSYTQMCVYWSFYSA